MKNDRKDMIKIWCGIALVLISFFLLEYNQPKSEKIKCVDGDTFAIGDTWYRLSFIDTAEIGEPTFVASLAFTCDYLYHNDLKLKTHGKDIYGRTLVEVNPQLTYSLNELLIKECLAKPFWDKTSGDVINLYNNCK